MKMQLDFVASDEMHL